MVSTPRDDGGAEVGDEVLLRVPPRRLVLSYLILFGLPLLCMAGAFGLVALSFSLAGEGNHQGAAVIAAVIAGLAGFWLGAFLAGRRGFSPEVLAVLGKAESDGEEGGYRGRVL
jgi:positive regulator of sigma E activity